MSSFRPNLTCLSSTHQWLRFLQLHCEELEKISKPISKPSEIQQARAEHEWNAWQRFNPSKMIQPLRCRWSMKWFICPLDNYMSTWAPSRWPPFLPTVMLALAKWWQTPLKKWESKELSPWPRPCRFSPNRLYNLVRWWACWSGLGASLVSRNLGKKAVHSSAHVFSCIPLTVWVLCRYFIRIVAC